MQTLERSQTRRAWGLCKVKAFFPAHSARLYHNPPFFIELLRAAEDNRADDALMVDQGVISRLDNLHFRC